MNRAPRDQGHSPCSGRRWEIWIGRRLRPLLTETQDSDEGAIGFPVDRLVDRPQLLSWDSRLGRFGSSEALCAFPFPTLV